MDQFRTVSKKQGVDIGCDPYLDWVLPDPDKNISGHHCEIRYYDSHYWLIDISANGTFINGSKKRLDKPYPLEQGDKIAIGHYIIEASMNQNQK